MNALAPRIVRCQHDRHGAAMLAIFNDAILQSTALYDYKPRRIESMRSWFDAKARGDFPVIGIEDDTGELMGVASYGAFRAWPAYKYSVEHSVYVDARFRGHGIGKRLLQEIIVRPGPSNIICSSGVSMRPIASAWCCTSGSALFIAARSGRSVTSSAAGWTWRSINCFSRHPPNLTRNKSMNKTISTPEAPKPAGPYAQAIRAGSTVYCAGQIPIDPKTGELVADDIAQQTRRVLQNLRAVLSAEGMSLRHVVKTTVFLADMSDYPVMNEAYAGAVAGHLPARTTVEVSALPRGARIEIDAVAVAE